MFFEELFDYKLSLNLHLTLRRYFSGLRPYLLNFQTPLPMLFHKLIFDFYATYLPHPCPVLSLYIQNHMNMKIFQLELYLYFLFLPLILPNLYNAWLLYSNNATVLARMDHYLLLFLKTSLYLDQRNTVKASDDMDGHYFSNN